MPTPEEAARGSIPERYGRALATVLSPDGQLAAVLLGTNEKPYVYPYLVVCHRTDEGWTEGSGGTAVGSHWSSTTPDADAGPNLGVVMLVGEAPAAARQAVITWRREEEVVPVSHGYYLYAVWDVPDSSTNEWPMLVRFVFQP